MDFLFKCPTSLCNQPKIFHRFFVPFLNSIQRPEPPNSSSCHDTTKGGGWQRWGEPVITESFDPARITVALSFEKIGGKKSAIKIGGKKSAIKARMKDSIIDYLTDHTQAKAAEIAAYIGLKPSRTRDYLAELIAEDIVEAEGGNRNRMYRLKA